MQLLTFKQGNDFALGIKTDKGIVKASLTPDDFFTQGNAALGQLESDVANASDADYLEEAALDLAACVPNPGKILCVGLNYARHAKESGMAEPSSPVLFSKFNNSLAAPNENVPLPSNAVEYDYEAELVVVIGKQAKNVSEADALEYVLGYCNGNDISARDLQFRSGQWLLGKSLDKFMPIGPYVVTKDEAGDPTNMQVRCWLNGELRQDSNTVDLIFSVAEIVSYASQYMTLEAGDIISTGTPEGVIMGMDPKVWMKAGDETVVEVASMGRLSNKMV